MSISTTSPPGAFTEIRLAASTGVLAGLCGGAALLVLMAVVDNAKETGAWRALKMAALPLFPEHASVGGFDLWPVLAGVPMHFAIAALWGGVLGLCFGRLGRRCGQLPRRTARLAMLTAGAMMPPLVWYAFVHGLLASAAHPAAAPTFATLSGRVPMSVAIIELAIFGLVTANMYIRLRPTLPQMAPALSKLGHLARSLRSTAPSSDPSSLGANVGPG